MNNKIKNLMQEVNDEIYEKTSKNTLKTIQENWDRLVRKVQSLKEMDNKRFQQIEELIEEDEKILKNYDNTLNLINGNITNQHSILLKQYEQKNFKKTISFSKKKN